MFDITPHDVALVLTIVVLIVGTKRFAQLAHGDEVRQLLAEVKRRMPVFSAETTQGREAEFIRDRLPKRLPLALVLLAVVLFGALAWWLNR